jgi:SulP family sulfate permease
VLLAVLVLAPLVSFLPMASLAALLLLVAWNMSEAKHFAHTLRVAPRSDVLVLLTCFTLTVLFDMTISVTFGVLLAALLFMRRMSELSGARLREGRHEELDLVLPPGVIVYEIGGPLFFGAAQKAMSALDGTAATARVVIFDLDDVPAMDGTGLVAFESALARLRHHHTLVLLAGVRTQPQKVLNARRRRRRRRAHRGGGTCTHEGGLICPKATRSARRSVRASRAATSWRTTRSTRS